MFCLGAAALPLVETRSVCCCWRLRVAFEAEGGCCCYRPSRLHVLEALTWSIVQVWFTQHNNPFCSARVKYPPQASTQAAKVRPCALQPRASSKGPSGCALPSRRKHALTTTNIITTFDTRPPTFATTVFTTPPPLLLSPALRNRFGPNRDRIGAALTVVGLRDKRSACA